MRRYGLRDDPIRHHVMAGERIHGYNTAVPVLARSKTVTGRLGTYARDDRPFAARALPATVFYYARDRTAEHANRHLAGYAGILQADAYAGFNDVYAPNANPVRSPRRRAGAMVGASSLYYARSSIFAG